MFSVHSVKLKVLYYGMSVISQYKPFEDLPLPVP